ncbi:MAG: hypothetical protein L6R42_008924, partial [Xanthoria sp. 1 TBL-2021]
MAGKKAPVTGTETGPLSKQQQRLANRHAKRGASTPTDHHATAFEGLSEPLNVSADPVRESSSRGQAGSSTVPSSSLANNLSQPNTLRSPQTSRADSLLEDIVKDPGYNAVQDSAEGPAEDPAGDAAQALAPPSNTCADWGGDAYTSEATLDTALMRRPGYGAAGTGIGLRLNSHLISRIKAKGKAKGAFRQYDVHIGSGNEKRGLIRAVLGSNELLKNLPGTWVFNGDKIAWSDHNAKEALRLTIDLHGKPSPGLPARAPDNISVVIRSTGAKIDLSNIYDYMGGICQFDGHVVSAINFLDHVIRQWPSKQHTIIKRSYFNQGFCKKRDLGGGVEVMSGIYQSIRMAEGSHLVANVDVSRTAFWNFRDFKYIISRLAKHERDVGSLAWRHGNQETNSSFDMIRRLKGSWFTVEHENQSVEAKKRQWKVAAIRPESAREHKFKIWDSTKNTWERETTILDYYQHEYKVRLAYPDLPVVETTKTITKRDEKGKIIFESPIIFPLEFCSMRPNQRYSYRLDEDQTSEMIEFAVQGPEQRLDEINRGLGMLGWEKDGFLDRCGLKICREQIRTKARILDPPKLIFKGSDLSPGTSGKWQLTNKMFIAPNTAPLVSWGVMIVKSTQNGRLAIEESKAKDFVSMLVNQYKGFGGDIKTEKPLIRSQECDDLATAIQQFHDDVRKEFGEMRPQMLVFILPDTKAPVYLRIKKLCDCQFGVYSQCVQAKKARKLEYSYIANLLMKFNAKLGGTTNIIASQKPEQSLRPSGVKQPKLRPDFGNVVTTRGGPATKPPPPAISPPPAMYIGADVSHPAPGGHAPSYAAMTVSMDKTATRYCAAVQTNGFRQEMISTQNLGYCLKPLLQKWIKDVSKGSLPDHVYYFRDGVGESRFKELLAKEVADIRQIFRELNGIHSELK